jgi:hypothetical protein
MRQGLMLLMSEEGWTEVREGVRRAIGRAMRASVVTFEENIVAGALVG